MNNPQLSIIIATYNSASVLRTALDSVCNLSSIQWECIVVDGASTDGTIDIIKEYHTKNNHIRYISEPDKGIYDAFNKGWQLARGEWVYYLGSDDELIPEGIERLLTYTEACDCVYGYVYIRENEKEVYACPSKSADTLTNAMCCCHQAMIMKRSVIAELGGFDLAFPVYADYELVLRAFLHNKVFRKENIATAFFSCNGVSSNISWKLAKEQYLIFKKNSIGSYPWARVAWNFSKMFVRQYIYDPKKHKK